MTSKTESVAAAPAFRPRQLLPGLVISLVTIVLLLGGIELAGTVWEKKTAQGPLGWTLVAARRIELEPHGTADQPYLLFKPNGQYNWEGESVEINERGFRTDEFQVPKPDGVTRILNVGDSIAFGWEVGIEETYGKQLESSLNAAADGRRYEVINAGVPSWNLEMERNFLLQEGLSYDPDLVVLDLTIVNDINGGTPLASRDKTLHNWLRDNTRGWPFLSTQLRFLIARQQGPEAMPELNPPLQARAYYPLETDHPKWETIWALIEEMQQASEARGIPFVILAFPTAFQLNAAPHPDVPQQVIGGRAEEAGIEFIDLLPVYQQTCAAADPDACEGYENLLFADVWMHPNPLGHRLAAEQLLGVVRQALAEGSTS